MNNFQSSAIVANPQSIKVKDTEYLLGRHYDVCCCKEIIIASEKGGEEKFRIEIEDRYLRGLDEPTLIEIIKKHIISQLYD